MTITLRKYLFPYRTQKSSSNVPKILAGYPAGKIGVARFNIFPVSSVGRALGCKAGRKTKELAAL